MTVASWLKILPNISKPVRKKFILAGRTFLVAVQMLFYGKSGRKPTEQNSDETRFHSNLSSKIPL
jgi:hypothetical protein